MPRYSKAPGVFLSMYN